MKATTFTAAARAWSVLAALVLSAAAAGSGPQGRAAAAAPPPVVGGAGGDGRTELDAEVKGRRFYVKVNVKGASGGEGKAATLLVDTGAETTVLQPEFLKGLNVSTAGADWKDVDVMTAGGPAKSRKGQVAEIDCNGLKQAPFDVIVAPHPEALAGSDGVLGMDFLGKFHVGFHLETKKVVLTPQGEATESWTVVLYQDKPNSELDRNPTAYWDTVEKRLIANLDQKQIKVEPSDSPVQKSTFAEMLFELNRQATDQPDRAAGPFVWTFDVQSPPFKRIVFDRSRFVVEAGSATISPKDGGMIGVADRGISQTWQVRVENAPFLPRDEDPELTAAVELANGTPVSSKRIRVTVRPGEKLLNQVYPRKLTLTFPNPQMKTQLLQLIKEDKGAVTFGKARPPTLTMFIHADSVPEPLPVGFAGVILPTRQTGAYYYISTPDADFAPSGELTTDPGAKWDKARPADITDWIKAGYPRTAPGINDETKFHELRLAKASAGYLIVGKRADNSFDVRLVRRNDRLEFATWKTPAKLNKAWAEEMFEKAKLDAATPG